MPDQLGGSRRDPRARRVSRRKGQSLRERWQRDHADERRKLVGVSWSRRQAGRQAGRQCAKLLEQFAADGVSLR